MRAPRLLVHLVEAGEVESGLGGRLLEFLLRAALSRGNFTDGEPLVLASLPRYGFILAG